MTSTARAEFDNVLWADVQSRPTFGDAKPLLAHYTSIDTLEKIITSGEVWLGHPLFMNDFEELRFGITAGAHAFRSNQSLVDACGSARAYERLIMKFNELYDEFDDQHVLDTYVLCLCEHDASDEDGALSMWRGYGANGGGVAIVFDASVVPIDQSSAFVVDKVHYASTAERRGWINEKVNALASKLSAVERSDETVNDAASAFFDRLKLFALFSKHDGFREEREWRVVYMKDRDVAGTYSKSLGYAITARGIEPKLHLRVEELPAVSRGVFTLESLIDRVILGPTVSSEVSRRSTRRMLQQHGMADLANRVSASSIPFRTNR